MADNVTVGSFTYATDDIGGNHYQRVKLSVGADGAATDVSTAAPLPVSDAGGSLTIDNAALAVVGGGTEATAQRVTLASDSTGILTVEGTVTADLSATDNAVLDAIAASVSGATPAGTNNIGDVDVLTLPALPTGTNDIGNVNLGAVDNAVLDSIAASVAGATPAGTNNIGDVDVLTLPPIPAGTNNIGDVDVLTLPSLPAGANAIGTVSLTTSTANIGNVQLATRTTGGTTPFKNLDVNTTDVQVKGTAGQVYWIHAINRGTAMRYLKFYNATAASTTVGSGSPVLTFPIPTQGDSNGAGFALVVPHGIAFSTAITIAATTGFADNDTASPGANEVIVMIGYA